MDQEHSTSAPATSAPEPTTPESSRPTRSRIAMVLRVLFFVVTGLLYSALTAAAAPSFWYVPVAVLLFVSGFLWYRPRTGASASLPLCLVLSYMLILLKPWHLPYPYVLDGVVGAALLLGGLALCFVELTRVGGGLSIKPFAIFVGLTLVGFIVDRTFTNRVEIRTLSMNWVADGKDPGGDPAEPNADGEKPIFVYTHVPGAFCYDAIFSEPLRQKLIATNTPLVKVEYNEFRTWGRITAYNVRSVAGMKFNEGRHVLIPNKDGYGGTMLTSDKTDAVSFDAPPCPR